MADNLTKAQRSRNMCLVKSRDTSTEIAVRQLLHAAGLRFRLHVTALPGKPDIVLPRHRTVVFVHGCLWHQHGCKRSRMPATNTDFWARKIARNVDRDAEHVLALREAGWRVETVWGCQVSQDTERVIAALLGTCDHAQRLQKAPRG
jgi:DNA mismatch endonuclease (patch repair protein)